MAVLDQQGAIKMSETLVLNLEIEILGEDGVATVTCPPELRITERVASVLHQAVDARGLKLKHWSVSEDQKRDLEILTNVIIEGFDKIEIE